MILNFHDSKVKEKEKETASREGLVFSAKLTCIRNTVLEYYSTRGLLGTDTKLKGFTFITSDIEEEIEKLFYDICTNLIRHF